MTLLGTLIGVQVKFHSQYKCHLEGRKLSCKFKTPVSKWEVKRTMTNYAGPSSITVHIHTITEEAIPNP